MNIGDTILPSDCSDNCVNLIPIQFTVYKALVHYYMNPGEIFFYWFVILCFPILSRKLELTSICWGGCFICDHWSIQPCWLLSLVWLSALSKSNWCTRVNMVNIKWLAFCYGSLWLFYMDTFYLPPCHLC